MYGRNPKWKQHVGQWRHWCWRAKTWWGDSTVYPSIVYPCQALYFTSAALCQSKNSVLTPEVWSALYVCLLFQFAYYGSGFWGMSGLHLIDFSWVRTWPSPLLTCGCVCEREFRRRTEKSCRVGRNLVCACHGRNIWVDMIWVVVAWCSVTGIWG
jgi:hypothetical protein